MHLITELQNTRDKTSIIVRRNGLTINVVRNFSTLVSMIYRTSRQKINKEIEDLNNFIKQLIY